jgi:hypothetical protein
MTKIINLDDIIFGMECQTNEITAYLDKRNYEIITISNQELEHTNGTAKEQTRDWHLNRTQAQEIQQTKYYLKLPTIQDIDEYELMAGFCQQIKDKKIKDKLCCCIKEKQAFMFFKKNIFLYNLAENWYEFRDKAFKKIAINWCHQHNILFDDN